MSVEQSSAAVRSRRAPANIHDQSKQVYIPGQQPTVIWLTGLSGSGKSTISRHVESDLRACRHAVATIDGDALRAGLCNDLGFTSADRDENVRRAAEVARLMSRAGLIVLVSLISPFRQGRAQARSLFEPGQFFETYVDTPLNVAEARDPKRLYRNARSGNIDQFTGVDSPYERPESAEIELDTVAHTPGECAQIVVDALIRTGRVSHP